VRLGAVALGQGRADEAVELCTRALALDREFGDAFEFRGLARFTRLKGFSDEEARQTYCDLSDWSERTRDDVEPLLCLATFSRRAGRVEDMYRFFHQIEELEPDCLAMLWQRGLLSIDHARGNVSIGAASSAITDFKRITSVTPDDGSAWFHLAEAYSLNRTQKLANYDAAVAAYQRAVELDPKISALDLSQALELRDAEIERIAEVRQAALERERQAAVAAAAEREAAAKAPHPRTCSWCLGEKSFSAAPSSFPTQITKDLTGGYGPERALATFGTEHAIGGYTLECPLCHGTGFEPGE